MEQVIKECKVCGTNSHVEVNRDYFGYYIYCTACYDAEYTSNPLEVISESIFLTATSEKEVIEEWNNYE